MSEQASTSSPAPSPLLLPLLGPAVSRRAVGPRETGAEPSPSLPAGQLSEPGESGEDLGSEDAARAGFHQVAERLEAIAASLRHATPRELLEGRGNEGGEMDPLEILITGYALGFSQAPQRVEVAPRSAP